VFSILVDALTLQTFTFIDAKVQGVSLVSIYDTRPGATIVSTKDFRKIPIELRPAKIPHYHKLVSASEKIIEGQKSIISNIQLV
jgi:hypothetical protein